MNRFVPILSLFFVLFSAYYSHAQSTEDSEHRFMIHQQFGKESGISKALSSIHLNIIKGKYKEAQAPIQFQKLDHCSMPLLFESFHLSVD